MKKGISLISLAITIVVLLIILSTVVVSTVSITNNSKKITFAKDLKSIEEAVASQYNTSGVLPIVNGVEYSVDNIIALAADGEKLNLELIENADNDIDNKFYEVNLAEIGIKSTNRGNKKNGRANDVYLVSGHNLNIYYPLGLKAGGNIYFSLTDSLIKGTKISKKPNEEAGNADNILANGIKISKDKKIWTSEMTIMLDIDKDEGDVIKYSIGNNITEMVASTDKIILNATELISAGWTLETWGLLAPENRKVIVRRYNSGGTKLVEVAIDIKNLDIESPTMGSDTPDIEANANENILDFSDMSDMLDTGGSGIKELKYEYITKLNSNSVDENVYNPQPTIDATYFKNNGKVVNSDKRISIPNHIKVVSVTCIDNAGNIASPVNYSIDLAYLTKEAARDSLNDYVKEGLVLHYDGINNTGQGYSGSTNVWRDLSDNGRDGTLVSFQHNASSGWIGNGLSFNRAGSNYVIISGTGQMRYPSQTIEVFVKSKDAYPSSTSTTIFHGIIAKSFGGQAGETEFSIDWYGTNTSRIMRTTSIAAYNFDLYSKKRHIGYISINNTDGYQIVDGTKYSKQTINPTNNSSAIRVGSSFGGYFLNGIVYSVRIYNRELTEEELKQNYANDIKRFGIN